MEGNDGEPEHIEGGHAGSREAQNRDNPVPSSGKVCPGQCVGQYPVLAKETRGKRNAGKGQGHKQEGKISPGHFLSQSAHIVDILWIAVVVMQVVHGMVHGMDYRTCGKE